MKHDQDSRETLLALAADALDGTATDADLRRLEGLLKASPEARADYLALAFIHAQVPATSAACGTDRLDREWLRRTAATVSDDPPEHQESVSTTAMPRPIVRMPLAAAASVLVSAVCLAVLLAVGGTAVPSRRQADPAVKLVTEAVATGDAADLRGSYYDDRELPVATVAFVSDGTRAGGRETARADRGISPTTLRSPEPTDLKSVSGAAVHVDRASVFGVSTADSGTLFSGGVQARVEGPDSRFSVVATNLRVVDLGTEFRVDRVDDDEVAVTVLDGEVEVQSRVRLPVCYWPFDQVEAGGTVDVVSGLEARLGKAATPCAGLVGGGALEFDNSADAAATVAGGTGEKVGTGLLACAEGISIEAVIVSRWTGSHLDYDEIYRKEDGTSRVLLSFQNDSPNYGGFSEPTVAGGP
ncbi:MAG: FecR domain-containing protein, partial [Planctomycetia bacterium]